MQSAEKPVIFVVGADEMVGKMAVTALSLMHGKTMDIRAGVRDPAKPKAKKMKSLIGVTVLQAELGKKERLRKLFEDVDAVYIISSDYPVQDRARLIMDTASAAKEAGVGHILLYSLVAAEKPDTMFGKQYNEAELAVGNLGVPYTILRLPILIDNLLGYRQSIKENSTIYWPVNPAMPFTPVVTRDASVAAAVILGSPQKHEGKTYSIVGDRLTYNDIVKAFTKALGRHVGYVRISYEDAKAFLQKHSFTEMRAEAVMEMYRLVDAGSPVTNRKNLDDFTEITGQKPTDVETWISQRAYLFN